MPIGALPVPEVSVPPAVLSTALAVLVWRCSRREVKLPGLAHEGLIELLRRNPLLAVALLTDLGLTVPAGGDAALTAADLSSARPAELRADAVVIIEAREGGRGTPAGKLAVVIEVQTVPDNGKRRVWPAYLALARAQHDCPAVLLVICFSRATGRWARRPIPTGHPGFDLVPLVIDAGNTPPSDAPGLDWAAPELVAAADLDADGLETYTPLIRTAASPAARNALEALMTIAFKDDFIDRIKEKGKAEGKEEGKAEGKAEMLLHILAARGFEVPERVRERVLGCTDPQQIYAWTDIAVTAASLEDVFQG
jgi:hypothetical protein